MKPKIIDEHRIYIPITRLDEEKRLVYGYMTREDLKDTYGTVIDLESVKRCLPDYMNWKNVREMHQPSAVGRVEELTVDDVGVYVCDYIADDQAWKKCVERIYKGFSIGGKKDYQEGDRLYLKKITEHSLVDRPSNEGCTIDEIRLHGGDDMKWTCAFKDHEHKNEGEAQACIDEIVKRLDAGETVEGLSEEFLAERAAKQTEEKNVDENETRGNPNHDDKGRFSSAGGKSWNSLAKESSDKANAASAKAEKENTAESHIKAADAHHSAYWMNSMISGGKGDKTANEHKDKANYHIGKWNDALDAKEGKVNKIMDIPDIKRYLGEEVWDVQTAVSCLNDLIYLWSKEMQEEHPEAESQAADLQTAIEKLKSFIASEILEVKEDSPKIISLMAGIADEIQRKGARNNKDDAKRLQIIHDHAVDMGARCEGVAKIDGGADVQRMATLEAENTTLKTSVSDTLKVIGDLNIERKESDTLGDIITRLYEHVEKLKAEPAPAKGVKTVVVSKEDDASGKQPEVTRLEETEEYKNADDVTRAAMAIKETIAKGPVQIVGFKPLI